MGSGVVKGQQQPHQLYTDNYHSTQPHRGISYNRSSTNAQVMACDMCSANFTFFKRKHLCKDCAKYFCNKCMAKEPNRSSSQRRCQSCLVLSSPDTYDRNVLMQLKIKDLRQYLALHSVAVNTCTEKIDLVELLIRYHANRQNAEASRRNQFTTRTRVNPEPQMRSQTTTTTTTGPQQSPSNHYQTRPEMVPETNESEEERMSRLRQRQEEEMRQHEARRMAESPEPPPDSRPARQRASISDLSEINDIDNMTIRQLKEILATNFVDFKGCCEKWELVERVKRLFKEKNELRQKADEILNENEEHSNSSSGANDSNFDELCKICMSSPIDCVLLECGHMVTCTKCGKRMAECPVCRQFVVRVVHTFRS